MSACATVNNLAASHTRPQTCLVDAGPINDECIGDDQVEDLGSTPARGLAHTLANRLSSTELDFVAIHRLTREGMSGHRGDWMLLPTSSRSTSIQRAVSPRRTRSPTVGPNIATYASRPISVSSETSRAPGSGVYPKPFCTRFRTISSVRDRSTTPLARRLPPVIIFAPAIAQSDTVFVSPGSNRTAVPAAISRRFP